MFAISFDFDGRNAVRKADQGSWLGVRDSNSGRVPEVIDLAQPAEQWDRTRTNLVHHVSLRSAWFSPGDSQALRLRPAASPFGHDSHPAHHLSALVSRGGWPP